MHREIHNAEEHARWHAQRIEALTRPDGWLTLVGLVWLDDGSHRVGSAADCDVVLPSGPALLGTLHVAAHQADWQPAGGARLRLNSDAHGAPEIVSDGPVSFFLIERDGRLAARLRDENAPTRLNFHGIETYPFDPEWCVAAHWDGTRASFAIDGHAVHLSAQNPAAETLHFVIADATSGPETYGGGRFLFAPAAVDGVVQLDFNRAINPPCAFTPFAVCPLPPPGNRLPFALRAGERRWQAPDAAAID